MCEAKRLVARAGDTTGGRVECKAKRRRKPGEPKAQNFSEFKVCNSAKGFR